MNWISLFGILLGIILIIVLSVKGLNVIVSAMLASIVIILTNQMPFYEALLSGQKSYMASLGSYVVAFLPIFVLGSILGKYLEDGKATVTIANAIFKVVGKDNAYVVLVAIAAISAVLTYGGISLFIVIFTIVALARPIFRELNLPWRLVMVPLIVGGTTFTMTMVPGTPSIQNVIPTSLGTTLTAAPLLSIIVTIISIILGLLYIKWELKRAIASNDHYVEQGQVINIDGSKDLPSLFASVLPIITLIIIILVGSKLKIPNIILPALVAANLVSAVVLNKHIHSQLKTLNAGAINSLNPILFTAAAVGIGGVVTASPGFAIIQQAMGHIPGGTLVQIPVITGFLSMVTASASGALGIVIPSFGAKWVAAGISPEVVHRIAAMASSTFSAMPHSGFVFSCMAVFGLKHKEVYRPIFFMGLVSGTICLVAAMLLSGVLY